MREKKSGAKPAPKRAEAKKRAKAAPAKRGRGRPPNGTAPMTSAQRQEVRRQKMRGFGCEQVPVWVYVDDKKIVRDFARGLLKKRGIV